MQASFKYLLNASFKYFGSNTGGQQYFFEVRRPTFCRTYFRIVTPDSFRQGGEGG